MIIPHESDEVVAALVKALGKVRTVIDVGSGDGYEVSHINADRRIAIDAHPFIERDYPNVEYFNGAIAEFNGMATFYYGPGPGCSSLHDRGGESIEVYTYRLDNFCHINDIPLATVDALIIDTEGTTFDVLVGAGDIVSKYVKYIYAEVQLQRLYPNKLAYEIDRYLKCFGFHVDKVGMPSYESGPQANYLWTRR